MFEFLGELIGAALMAIFGGFAFFKPDRLVGYDGSPKDLQKRVRFMKFCGVGKMFCGSIQFIFSLVRLFIHF